MDPEASRRTSLPSSPTSRPSWPPRRALLLCGGLGLMAALVGAATGYFVRFDMPSVRRLEEHAPPEMTRLLARDGASIGTFAAEKRIVLDHGEIPATFRHALIASEDTRFLEHPGVDLVGILRALLVDLRHRRIVQGASTLTMQLAGGLFLDRTDRSPKRKLQEALLALEVERSYSKEEILRLYVNQVHFGHGLYGLEAASRHFFGKPARELSVGESATLVGILPRPARYSPQRDLALATRRRDLVLQRMVAEGYLAPEQAARAAAEPIRLARRGAADGAAPHFREEVRRQLEQRFGRDALFRGGLVVTTTLDPRMQAIANDALDRGLRALDKRQGYRRGDVRRVPPDADPSGWSSPTWEGPIQRGGVTDAVVVACDERRAEVRVGERTGFLDAASIRWTGEVRPDRLLGVGDVVSVRVGEATTPADLALELEQTPEVEGALIALDPTSGDVLAHVGGFDFARGPYDRALHARRQPGSVFKPFVYAAALARGTTLADRLLDEPTVFLDPAHPVPYQPENYERAYHGTITVRAALEASANIATVRLLQRVGYQPVIDTARALGLRGPLRPYPSLALGAFEATLLEVTSAYGAFAGQGLRFEPRWIQEVSGPAGQRLAIDEAGPRAFEAVSPQIAHLMNQALGGVVRRGTGRAAGMALARTIAGKTGTTDASTDAWFVGYTPGLVVGVWIGYDEVRSLGPGESGGRAALPIWVDFMTRALGETPDEPFPIPPGIRNVVIDARTGRRPAIGENPAERIVEVFLDGTEPTETCSPALHALLRLPYPFQRYPLDADGALAIPPDALEDLLRAERDVSFDREAQVLRFDAPDGVVRLAVRPLPPVGPATREPPPAGLDPSVWFGTDGRRASVIVGTPGAPARSSAIPARAGNDGDK